MYLQKRSCGSLNIYLKRGSWRNFCTEICRKKIPRSYEDSNPDRKHGHKIVYSELASLTVTLPGFPDYNVPKYCLISIYQCKQTCASEYFVSVTGNVYFSIPNLHRVRNSILFHILLNNFLSYSSTIAVVFSLKVSFEISIGI